MMEVCPSVYSAKPFPKPEEHGIVLFAWHETEIHVTSIDKMDLLNSKQTNTSTAASVCSKVRFVECNRQCLFI